MKPRGHGLNLSTKTTRKRELLEEMERLVPWAVLVQIVEPYCPKGKTGRPPFGIETMLRIHCLQQWFGLSDPAMEEALHDMPLYREFAKLDGAATRLPEETTIPRWRHLLEKHSLARDAPGQEAQQLVLRHEGPHRRGHRLWPGAQHGHDAGQRQRRDHGGCAAARG